MGSHPPAGRSARRSMPRACTATLLLLTALLGPPCEWAEAQSGGVISGTVTDAGTGAPLSGINVQVYTASGGWAGYATTNAAGAYTVPALATGTYYVRTSNGFPYLDELYDNLPCPGGDCTVTAGTGVNVTTGAAARVDFGLMPGGTITGTVTDANTAVALANLDVHVYTASGGWAGSSVATNGAGGVRGDGPRDRHLLRADVERLSVRRRVVRQPAVPGRQLSGDDGHTRERDGGCDDKPDRLRLGAGREDRGDGDGGGRRNAAGECRHRSLRGERQLGWPCHDGRVWGYTVLGLATGGYRVRTLNSLSYLDELYDNLPCQGGNCAVTAGTNVSVTAGTTTGGIDFALTLGGTISGTVTDAGAGMPLASFVQVYTASGGWAGGAATNAAGVYMVPGLATGAYYLRTSNSSPYLDERYNDLPCPAVDCTVTAGTSVSVTAGATTANIDFGLTLGGTITGTVTDEATGAPVAGIFVQVYAASGAWAANAMTDGAGTYRATGLSTGAYYIRTSNSGPYVDELYENVPCPGGSCAVTAGTGVSVAAGATTANIDFRLTLGGTIAGTVTDASTAVPLANLDVRVYAASGGWAANATTDGAGRYLATGLSTGTYYVQTSNSFPYVDELYEDLPCPGGSCTVTAGTGVSVTAGAMTANVNFGLTLGGTIAGTVTASGAGTPLANVSVEAFTASGSRAGVATTDASGAYTIIGLSTGTYYARTSGSLLYLDELYDGLPCPDGGCTVAEGTGVNVTAGAATVNVDFGLALGGTITGTISDGATGVPLAGIDVRIETSGGAWAGGAATNAEGLYIVAGLVTGTYYVRTSNSLPYLDELYNDLPCPGGNCTVTEGTGVNVTAGETATNVDFGLTLGATITGTVTDAGTGAPIAGIDVQVYAPGGGWAGHATTNAAGTYTVADLAAGTYYVRTANSFPYLDQLFDNLPCPGGNCTVTTGTGVSVAAGAATANIDFGLTPGGTIAGLVTDAATGTPLANLAVQVYAAGGGWVATGTTNGAGVYTVTGLAPGTYYVRTSNSFPYVDRLYDNLPCPGGNCTVTAGTGVSVTAGAVTSGIDFGLAAFGGGDFTGDLKSDVLWRHATNGEVWVWVMDGAARTAETYVRTVSDTNWEIRGQGDQDGDGDADLLWRHTVTGEIYFWPMTGTTPDAELYVATVDPAYDIVGTGDFDGDGKSDILWRHLTTGEVWIWLMDGPAPLSMVWVDTVDPAYSVKGVGDLDADTKADIVWHHATLGEVWVWLMNGPTRLSQTWVATVPDTGYQIQGVADVTGDGRADLVWHHATLGEVWIWTMNGAAREAETYVATVPDTNYQIAATGDYNGDTKADLLWHHVMTGEVWVWLMNGTTPISADVGRDGAGHGVPDHSLTLVRDSGLGTRDSGLGMEVDALASTCPSRLKPRPPDDVSVEAPFDFAQGRKASTSR